MSDTTPTGRAASELPTVTSDSGATTGHVAPLSRPQIPDVVLEDEIGRGGMGVVYRGRQTYLDRRVAVKLLLVNPAAGDGDFLRRFQREAKILAGLSHPHIVACYSANVTADGHPYLVMEYVDGLSLKDWLAQHGRLSVTQALTIVRDLATALEHARRQGIIHRDVKPENVLLQRSFDDNKFAFTAKLVDLGLARPTPGAGPTAMNLTAQGLVMGTPATMAPEQFDDPENVDHRADIYGLGCVLFHCLTGQQAFISKTFAQLVSSKVSGVVPNPQLVCRDLGGEVCALVLAMLQPQRESRPQSYADIIARCEQGLRASGSVTAVRRWWPAIAGTLIALALAVLLSNQWWYQAPRTGDPAPVPPSLPAPVPVAAQPVAIAPLPDVPAPAPVMPPLDTLTFAQPVSLLRSDFSTRLADWVVAPDARWQPSEEIDNAIVGLSGVLTRPLDAPPWRITGTFALVYQAGAKTDEAGLGVTLRDGTTVSLTLKNLGSQFLAVIETKPKSDAAIAAAPASAMLLAADAVTVDVIVDARRLLVRVGDTALREVALSAAPTGLVIHAQGPAPVVIRDLTLQRVRP